MLAELQNVFNWVYKQSHTDAGGYSALLIAWDITVGYFSFMMTEGNGELMRYF